MEQFASSSKPLNRVTWGGGRLRRISAVLELDWGAIEAIGDRVDLFIVQSDWVIDQILVSCDAIPHSDPPGVTEISLSDLGLYAMNGSDVNSALFMNDSHSFVAKRVFEISYRGDTINPLTFAPLHGPENAHKPIWELLGLPRDPFTEYILAFTIVDMGVQAPLWMTVEMTYLAGD